MKFPSELSALGYYVFPTTDRRKFPSKVGTRESWASFIIDGEQELLHALLTAAGEATGAALCPQPGDPVRLLILDLDTYGESFESIWAKLSPDEEPPKGTGIVASPSGGYHLWFRVPNDVNPDKLPATIDMGNGLSGEIRTSGKARRLIMLPESTVTNKQGKVAKYRQVRPFRVSDLPDPPPTLLARLCARKGEVAPKREEGGIPTEIAHVLGLIDRIPEIEKGAMNTTVAQVGQILGRISPSQTPNEDMLNRLWRSIKPKLDDAFDHKSFRVAIISGWKTGRKNADSYGAREKHPTVTDVKAECVAILGKTPWMVEVRDSAGKIQEYQVGLGGSSKRPEEADRMTRLKDLGEVLPVLTRLAGADKDTVARSPLFIQPGWEKTLRFMLLAEKGVDQLGIPPEEKFMETLENWARIAASDGLFLHTWTSKRPDATQAFIVWPVAERPCLCIPPNLQEYLLMGIGDLPKAKRMVNGHMLKKVLTGMRSGQKAWCIALQTFADTTQVFCSAQYEKWIAKTI